jgi:hypothetical protein
VVVDSRSILPSNTFGIFKGGRGGGGRKGGTCGEREALRAHWHVAGWASGDGVGIIQVLSIA